MAIRDHVVLLVNGRRIEVHDSDCFLTLSEFLRYRCGLVGTKVVCSEGDCGSCTVLVGQMDGPSMKYRPIDSCIRFVFQLDGVHVITVEGLSQNGDLTAVQQAMVDCHGSQCGFCTPGFVMAMTGLREDPFGGEVDENAWRTGLTGNLCRCTGYSPILRAGAQAATCDDAGCNEIYPAALIARELAALRTDTLNVAGDCDGIHRTAYCPATLNEALRLRHDHPQAKVIAGATDIGVQWNKRTVEPTLFLDLNRVAELQGAAVEDRENGRVLAAGARATWTAILALCREEIPEFAEIVNVFGSPQIRHVGTIGGNIINASPIADSGPFLFAMEAELELASAAGRRRVNINDFYRGYKQFDLRPDELLTRVDIPLPRSDEFLGLYKVSRRRDLDISTFTAAIRMRLDGAHIADAAIAYGAVGPTVLRLRRTEEFLRSRPFDEETMRSAGDHAVQEITPISDVRGSADYRFQLARNILLKFYHERQVTAVS